MIKLYACKYGAKWPVVQKLWSLVEKGGVILVPFQYEPGGLALPEARIVSLKHASDHESGLKAASRIKGRDQHGGRGGLPMGSRHHQGLSVLQKKRGHGLGKGDVRNSALKHVNRLGIVRPYDISYNDKGRRSSFTVFEVIGTVANAYRDFQPLKHVAHGRISSAVRPSYMVAKLKQKPCKGRHAGPAYSHEVDIAAWRREFFYGG